MAGFLGIPTGKHGNTYQVNKSSVSGLEMETAPFLECLCFGDDCGDDCGTVFG